MAGEFETMDDRLFAEEKEYLSEMIRKIGDQIEKTKEALSKGQKEIDNMHDYYWQNYTEMDQYGYEDYDNQQALLEQVNANAKQAKRKQRLKRMLDSPYFGRVDFRYEGEEEEETFYIGIGNFAERAGAVPLIYDWRAPVCGLFYDYDKGRASYQAPSGEMEGEICQKRQYKIQGGRLIYAFACDTKIDDDILKAELGGNGDVQLKNIVRTIQKEQNAIIRNTKDKILVIQGAAGSGKTSIALHRIAYLLYHDRERLKSSDILILSPGSVFSDYVSHILPELGEENIREMSFDLFAYRELKSVARDCEDRYDYLERQIRFPDREEELRYQEKQSASFIGTIEGFLAVLEEELVELRGVVFKGFQKTEEEIIKLFYYKFQNTPLLKRLDAVMEYFTDEYETLRGKNLSEEETEALQVIFNRMYVMKDIYHIYNRMLEDNGYEPLPDVETERRKIPYEDVYPMLYLKYRLEGQTARREIRHLVIDEMQDYSFLQYTILSQMFSCRMTILGDRAQTLDGSGQDVLNFLPKVFGKKLKKIVINKSYRNTLEIAEYAAKFIGLTGISFLERHGKEVEEQTFPTLDMLFDAVAENLSGDYETAALLTMTEEEAYDIYRLIKERVRERGISIHYIDRDSTAFDRGLTVTTYYLAKGLEFDQVFTVFPEKERPFFQQAAYISATRALHELYMYRIH
jgi:Superfamily I DNA and RNA helicases